MTGPGYGGAKGPLVFRSGGDVLPTLVSLPTMMTPHSLETEDGGEGVRETHGTATPTPTPTPVRLFRGRCRLTSSPSSSTSTPESL